MNELTLGQVKTSLSTPYDVLSENSNGSQLVLDPISGFLGFVIPPSNSNLPSVSERVNKYVESVRKTGTGISPFAGFSPEKKLLFLKHFPSMWPNITACCKRLHMDRNTFSNHYAIDSKFKSEIDAITQSKMDELKSTMWKFSKRPKNFMDRMAVGRVFEPETFDPARRLIISDQRNVTDSEARAVIRRVENAIDAEVVNVQNDPKDLNSEANNKGQIRG